MIRFPFTRRGAFQGLGAAALASAAVLEGQQNKGEAPGRIAPVDQLYDLFEIEAMAARLLAMPAYQQVAGGDRSAFDRMTFRPRILRNVVHLDLTVELFGDKHFTPILIGPVAQLQQYHKDGELALVRGASEGKTAVIISSQSSLPIDKIAAEAKTPLYYQVDLDPDAGAMQAKASQAVAAGCKAVFVTMGVPYKAYAGASKAASNFPPKLDWNAFERFTKTVKVPVALKGVMTPEDAKAAIQHGAQAVVVSNYGGHLANSGVAPIEVVESIVAQAGKSPVLVDGSFRRGTDILKALAFGARAALIARPAVWAVTYGAEGVNHMLKLLQSELARDMGLSGRPTIASIDRDLVRIHRA